MVQAAGAMWWRWVWIIRGYLHWVIGRKALITDGEPGKFPGVFFFKMENRVHFQCYAKGMLNGNLLCGSM